VIVTAAGAESFADCIAAGGVAIFPADTVYGLAAAPDSEAAVERLYALKGRGAGQPAAVMFFALGAALGALGDLGVRTRAAVTALLPGAVTLVVPNPSRRWPLAGGPQPAHLGIRVPALPPALAALEAVSLPVLQSSANPHGAADARRLADVDAAIRAGADLELDGGELPGTPSTVVDLTRLDLGGRHVVLREGAVPSGEIDRLLA
jgi:L-threonylcarbamoyladenylate synthase